MQTPIEAEKLLALLRRSISQTSVESWPAAAVNYVSGAPGPAERLRTAYDAVKAEASAFGSMPPSPPTVRARLALSLVRFVNRIVWWQTSTSKRFATAVCDFAQVQLESQAEQHARIEERLHALEIRLQELQKPIAGERP